MGFKQLFCVMHLCHLKEFLSLPCRKGMMARKEVFIDVLLDEWFLVEEAKKGWQEKNNLNPCLLTSVVQMALTLRNNISSQITFKRKEVCRMNNPSGVDP